MHQNPFVRKLENLTHLSEEERARCDEICVNVRRVPRKRDIIAEGTAPTHVHLVLDGWAARYKVLPDGSRQITAFLIPGDFCDLHVTVLSAMDHGIVALTDCEVAFIPDEAIEAVTKTTPSLTRALWWTTLVDEAVLREWIVNNGRRDSYTAVAHILCEMHLRMKMVGLADGDQIVMPLTQEELGDATGMTPVHMNRTLQRLREEGLIRLEQRMLTVPNVEALRKAGGFDASYLHIRRR